LCAFGKHESRPLALVEKHEKRELFKKHEKRSLKKAPRNKYMRATFPHALLHL